MWLSCNKSDGEVSLVLSRYTVYVPSVLLYRYFKIFSMQFDITLCVLKPILTFGTNVLL